jgi:hypothetical protein
MSIIHRDRIEALREVMKKEGIDAFMIPTAVKLGGKDTSAGTGAKNAQIEHKHELIDDRNATHGNGANLPHHDIIQHGNKIGDGILNNDWDCHCHNPAIKRPVANVSFDHKLPLM